MENIDLRVLSDLLAWKQAGHAATLVTLLETWGTSPRPAGGLLAFRDDGRFSGSGLGLEDDLIVRARAALQLAPPGDLPTEVVHALTQQQAEEQGLPCGGNLRLVREPVTDIGWLLDLLDRTADHRRVARTLTLATGEVTLTDLGTEPLQGEALAFDGRRLVRRFGPPWRVVLVGAGELGQAVAGLAQALDFQVALVDPRPGHGPERDRPGVTRLAGEAGEAVRAAQPDAHTAVVALSHEPALDDPGLHAALDTPAFYIGALGSKRNQEMRQQRLAERYGRSAEQFARVRGPAGLKLGGRTPSEMALAIVAELVMAKHGLAAATEGKA